MKQPKSIAEVVTEFFKADDWRFDELPTDNASLRIIHTDFQGENGVWRCYAETHEDSNTVVFYSILDTRIPVQRRSYIAELLTRANYGLMIGNFEMDFNDGETRYKTSITVEEDRLTVALMKSLVYINLLTFDRYLPGIMRVAFGDKNPAEAVTEIEGAEPSATQEA